MDELNEFIVGISPAAVLYLETGNKRVRTGPSNEVCASVAVQARSYEITMAGALIFFEGQSESNPGKTVFALAPGTWTALSRRMERA
jgi:hypothetical protein